MTEVTSSASPRTHKPDWIRAKAPVSAGFHETKALMRRLSLNTVCEEAACPNIGECWAQGHATVMILGDTCTRACAFCNVATGKPQDVDPLEPQNVALAVGELGLAHVVITSVDRDDLADGGAGHFVQVIERLRADAPETTIEVLTPDFLHKAGAIKAVARAKPDVYNHNVETVPRLYPSVRRGAQFGQSIDLLRQVKAIDASIFTKSGLMVGLGEKTAEVLEVMDAMRGAGVDFLTIGQYLQPTRRHIDVARFVTPEEFGAYAQAAQDKGFLMVSASPMTRSSYHAGDDFARLRAGRARQLAPA